MGCSSDPERNNGGGASGGLTDSVVNSVWWEVSNFLNDIITAAIVEVYNKPDTPCKMYRSDQHTCRKYPAVAIVHRGESWKPLIRVSAPEIL